MSGDPPDQLIRVPSALLRDEGSETYITSGGHSMGPFERVPTDVGPARAAPLCAPPTRTSRRRREP